MIDSLDRETQIAALNRAVAPASAASGDEPFDRGAALAPVDQIDQAMLDALANPELKGLLSRLMDGTEPYDRPLHPWEPRRFSVVNINTILMLAAGWRGTEVARSLGLERGRVSTIKNHPYGRKLLRALLPESVKSTLDVRARIKGYASDLLERLYEYGMSTEDPNVVARIGFGMMDRAGYSPVQKVDQRHRHELVLSEKVADRLATAMEHSQRAREIQTVDCEVLPAGSGVVGAPALPDGRAAEVLSRPSSGSQSVELPAARRLG